MGVRHCKNIAFWWGLDTDQEYFVAHWYEKGRDSLCHSQSVIYKLALQNVHSTAANYILPFMTNTRLPHNSMCNSTECFSASSSTTYNKINGPTDLYGRVDHFFFLLLFEQALVQEKNGSGQEMRDGPYRPLDTVKISRTSIIYSQKMGKWNWDCMSSKQTFGIQEGGGKDSL